MAESNRLMPPKYSTTGLQGIQGPTEMPPWMYQVDGVWYSEYDPSAPPRPAKSDGSPTPRWSDSNEDPLTKGQPKLPELPKDPAIPVAPLPGILKMNAPRILQTEDVRRTRAERFSTLGIIGGKTNG